MRTDSSAFPSLSSAYEVAPLVTRQQSEQAEAEGRSDGYGRQRLLTDFVADRDQVDNAAVQGVEAP